MRQLDCVPLKLAWGLAERWGILIIERINQGPTMNKGINYHPVYGIPLPLLPLPLETCQNMAQPSFSLLC